MGTPGGGAWALPLSALLWGLAGGFSHCIGMCGVFVLSCGPVDEQADPRRLGRQAAFHFGRLITLMLLGAGAGAIGSLVGLAARVGRAQGALSVAVGILLALLALGYVGVFPKLRVPEPDILGAGGGRGRKIYVALLRDKRWYQPAALGALVGLLPCGLTYTILIPAAATLSAERGALILLAFGMGTMPGLLTLGMAGHLLRGILQNPRFRMAMTRSGAAIMLVTGIVLIYRGWPNLR